MNLAHSRNLNLIDTKKLYYIVTLVIKVEFMTIMYNMTLVALVL